MAGLGSDHVGVVAAAAGGPGFVPEIWEDDVIAQYKANLVLANLVSKINHNGRKGDVLNLPSITDRKTAVPTAKAVNTAVTLVPAAASEVILTIDQHWEYSFLYEDITSLQALDSLRRHYTDHAGYALARKTDQVLWANFENMQGGANFDAAVQADDGTTVIDGTAGSNTGNFQALTDAGIRKMIQTLDDEDNPMSDRHLVIPPVERNNLMGLARFTEQAFVGEGGSGNTIRNGNIGQIYGVGTYISTNCPHVHTDSGDGDLFFDFSSAAATTGTDITGTAVTIGAGGVAYGRVGVMQHKAAIVHAEQQGIRTQTQYKQEYLGDLFTADCVFGATEQRDYAAVPFVCAI